MPLAVLCAMPGLQLASAAMGQGGLDHECRNVGACVITSGSDTYCLRLAEYACEGWGGTFHGEGTTCNETCVAGDIPFDSGAIGHCIDFRQGTTTYLDCQVLPEEDCTALGRGFIWVPPAEGTSGCTQQASIGSMIIAYPLGPLYEFSPGSVTIGIDSMNVGNTRSRSDEQADVVNFRASNAYVLSTDDLGHTRLEQLSTSGLNRDFYVLASPTDTCHPCDNSNGMIGAALAAYCSDFMSANLMRYMPFPRSFMDPTCGCYASGREEAYTSAHPWSIAGFPNLELPDGSTDSLYWESVTMAPSDLSYANDRYNVTHFRIDMDSSWMADPETIDYRPAITLLGGPEHRYQVDEVELSDGTFIVASRAFDQGDGSWEYEYAIWNDDSHDALGLFSLEIDQSVTVTNARFKGVDSPFDVKELFADDLGGRSQWQISRSDGMLAYSTGPYLGEPDLDGDLYGQQLPNPLEWGTMYNFRFRSDSPPSDDGCLALLGSFRTDASTGILVKGPESKGVVVAGCADFDGDGVVDGRDLATLLGCWGDNPCGDLTGDDVTAGGDLTVLLGAWGVYDCP